MLKAFLLVHIFCPYGIICFTFILLQVSSLSVKKIVQTLLPSRKNEIASGFSTLFFVSNVISIFLMLSLAFGHYFTLFQATFIVQYQLFLLQLNRLNTFTLFYLIIFKLRGCRVHIVLFLLRKTIHSVFWDFMCNHFCTIYSAILWKNSCRFFSLCAICYQDLLFLLILSSVINPDRTSI